MEFILWDLNVTPKDRTSDGQYDVIDVLKREYKQWVKRLIRENEGKELFRPASKKDMVRVYHGTSSYHLFDILTYGLKPRSMTSQSNWSIIHKGEDLASIDEVVYVTTKWHYYYASVTARRQNGTIPCVIAFDIPKAVLIPDEDSFHSAFSRERFWKYFYSNGEAPFHLSGEESLSSYYTAGVPLGIPASYIKEVTILGDEEGLSEILSPGSPYEKDLTKWASGQLEHDVKMSSIYKKVSRSTKNKTFMVRATNKDALSSTKTKIEEFTTYLSSLKTIEK